jgi:hypothetical protein
VITRKKRRRVKPKPQPNFVLLPFSMEDLLAAIRQEHFPELHGNIPFAFLNSGSLARIRNVERWTTVIGHEILAHQVLNRGDTPVEVMTLVLKHELTHLVIPPTTANGVTVNHPPAFWAFEARICPERLAAWGWVWMNLWDCLRSRPKLERIDVLPRWREAWGYPRLSMVECAKLALKRPDAPDYGSTPL